MYRYAVAQRNSAYRQLRGEQERAESLLLNILPRDIAAILKSRPRTIAEHFDGATILFADVVNFTPMSATMTPVELVELLNEVFFRLRRAGREIWPREDQDDRRLLHGGCCVRARPPGSRASAHSNGA
jgi:class 3 adenylate cyclase